jgi:hypothetical protein
VCIRAAEGMCCIQYQVCPDQAMGFGLGTGVIAAAGVAKTDDSCLTNDYIGIPGSGKYMYIYIWKRRSLVKLSYYKNFF